MTDAKNSQSIFKKLIAAKAEFNTVLKNKVNPHFKSSYADLGAILDAIEPALHKHGLMLTQPISGGSVMTIITDGDTKESVRSEISLPEGLDAQKTGAAISYYRRFSLQSLLALHSEDDDAESVKRPEPYKAQVTAPPYKSDVPKVPSGAGVIIAAREILKSQDKVWPSNANATKKPARYTDYRIGFGKYKDKTLGEVGIEALANYSKWLQQDTSKPPSGSAVELIMRIKDHLADMAGNTQTDFNQETPPPHSDQDIPF